MRFSRRHLLIGSLAAASVGTQARAAEDRSPELQALIDRAARSGTPLTLPPGTFRAHDLMLRSGARINAKPGATRIVFGGGDALITARDAAGVSLSGLTLDGGRQTIAGNGGLVRMSQAERLLVSGCTIANVDGNALSLTQCGGIVGDNTITDAADTALFSLDSRLLVRGNSIARSGNGGIRVWRSAKQSDGSVIEGNTIADTRARGGGDGQNGNAINVFRAADVTVRGNTVRNAAFTAVRGNAASRITIVGNRCFALGEVAIYSEFEFEDATIEGNLIDVAAVGIAVTNMDRGGHGAVVRNNTIRNMVNKRPQGGPDSYGVGIGVEADTEVTGNTIENAPVMGIEVGSGKYLRNVTVSRNRLRKTGIGIGVTVVEGAGSATITDNVIADAKDGAVVGMRWDKPATGDLTRGGAEAFAHLRIAGNQVSR
jgi:uncharacterized secreted repeat protein (TIGR03808 family)